MGVKVDTGTNDQLSTDLKLNLTSELGIPISNSSSPPSVLPSGVLSARIRQNPDTDNIEIWNGSIWEDTSTDLLKLITVDTYSLMLSQISNNPKMILVLDDENKNQENTIYQIYPQISGTPIVMWIAAIQEII